MDAQHMSLICCVDKAVRGIKSCRVDRTCVSGSLARGTYELACEPVSLCLFLNVDLGFGLYDVPEALDAIAAGVTTALASSGWDAQLDIVDGECRGGLWAVLRAVPLRSAEADEPASSHGADAAELAVGAAASGSGGEGSAAKVSVQLLLAENMCQRTAPDSEAEKPDPQAAGAHARFEPVQPPVDEGCAEQQRESVLRLAERSARRAAHHGGSGTAAAAERTSKLAKLSAGLAEARRLYWLRQPKAALAAARSAHRAWCRVAGEEDPRLWDDAVLHLLDTLVLHAYDDLQGTRREGEHAAAPSAGAQDPGGEHGERSTLRQAFGKVATAQRPERSDDGECSGSAAAASDGGSGMDAGALSGKEIAAGAGLEVLDPCFPLSDLYAAACKAVGEPGDEAEGHQRLTQLAAQVVMTLQNEA
ncbi:hypothetical protein GPECTOR_1g180 [Gonium pectorale]|uniref:Uncharacterized protein n=1 Tax=Gonium pectorale TaxID=33097 RepID=A0A150H2Z5_GONPE|nr:hypothetical protein GPECTOR_1g180 [Gonium pectorale]|eukprot:KXZ56208.1 hypothetical protein GPECTOR_1g180 [Gonium pectorale]